MGRSCCRLDGDLLIVRTGVKMAGSPRAEIFIIGQDIDLLILLIYYTLSASVKLLKLNDRDRSKDCMYCPEEIQATNLNLKEYISFIHAFSGK